MQQIAIGALEWRFGSANRDGQAHMHLNQI